MGLSSNKVLQKTKHLLRADKAGHTGSLDPLATGMLPICLNDATKFARFLLHADKSYEAEATLGVITDSGDAEGTVLQIVEVPKFSLQQIEQVLSSFVGELEQVPPMYSALKINGVPYYKLARRGIEVARKARKVTIYSIELLSYAAKENKIKFRVACSKGTYIRTLAEDIGSSLGVGAHISALRRLQVTPYQQEHMLTLDEVRLLRDSDISALERHIFSIDKMVAHLPRLELNDREDLLVKQGIVLDSPGLSGADKAGVKELIDKQVNQLKESPELAQLKLDEVANRELNNLVALYNNLGFLGVAELTAQCKLKVSKLIRLDF